MEMKILFIIFAVFEVVTFFAEIFMGFGRIGSKIGKLIGLKRPEGPDPRSPAARAIVSGLIICILAVITVLFAAVFMIKN